MISYNISASFIIYSIMVQCQQRVQRTLIPLILVLVGSTLANLFEPLYNTGRRGLCMSFTWVRGGSTLPNLFELRRCRVPDSPGSLQSSTRFSRFAAVASQILPVRRCRIPDSPGSPQLTPRLSRFAAVASSPESLILSSPQSRRVPSPRLSRFAS